MNTQAVQQVLLANDAFYLAFAGRDFEAMERLWARTFDVLCTHPGWSPLNGREVVLESWRAILQDSQDARIECWNPVAHVYENFAMVTCYEVIDGNALSVTNAFVLEDDVWSMVHHHAGPMATPPPRPKDQTAQNSGSLH